MINDGVDANLSDRTKMSTRALIHQLWVLVPTTQQAALQTVKEDFTDIEMALDELYQRHVVKPLITDKSGAI